MVIKDIATRDLGRIIFSWDQNTITLFTRFEFHIYNRLNGEQIYEGELMPLPNYQLGALYVHEESLQFAISSKTGQEHVINIQELQPTSDPLLHVVKSFPISPQDGQFSYCPVSSHASFVSSGGIVILNVQDSKVLFQSKGAGTLYRSSGQFSHDGQFCACGTMGGEVCILENTSTGYVPRSRLRPRLSWSGFSWSPTSISIMCWGASVIQLLHPDNCLSPTSANLAKHVPHTDRLVVYSEDWTYIIIAQRGGGKITVLDPFGTTQQSIDTNVSIKDIKIVGDTIFVIDGVRNRLSSWRLITGGQVNNNCGVERENRAFNIRMPSPLALSSDGSQVAFAVEGAAFLYDVQAQVVLGDLITDGNQVTYIQFSPDGSQLWFIVHFSSGGKYKCYRVELDKAKDPCFGNVTIEDLEDEWSLDSIFRSPGEYRIIGKRSKWVSGPQGNVLWLPVNWRKTHGLNTRWDGNLLALLSGYHPETIIIEFQ